MHHAGQPHRPAWRKSRSTIRDNQGVTMRTLIRCLLAGLFVLADWARPASLVLAANLDTIADRVLGQPNFSSASVVPLSASSLFEPGQLAVDRHTGRLFVADTLDNRVLSWPSASAFTNNQAADLVIGQADFTHNDSNAGGLGAASLRFPAGVALNEQGDLFVADQGNNRVLEYDAPLTPHAAAARVFGQLDFAHSSSGLGLASVYGPSGIALDGQGDLYVADAGNNRVLEFNASVANDASANRVFGQPDFLHNDPGLGAAGLNAPLAVALDAQGNLFVADGANNRVVEIQSPLTTNAAVSVFGQPDFNQHLPNNGGISAAGLNYPSAVALDAQGDLYVADGNNSRVLEYDAPLSSTMAASRVFGQPDYSRATPNTGGVSAASLAYASGVAVDAQGDVLVADLSNNRVLEYDVPVPYAVPAVLALAPARLTATDAAFSITVNGSGFERSSVVRWNGASQPTTFLDSTQLEASIGASSLTGGGPFAVTVFTPGPGGGSSSLLNLPLDARSEQDATADAVQGQPDFTHNTANNPLLPGAGHFSTPVRLTVDTRTGRLFVADYYNNRVLSWPNSQALVSGQPADLVLGQPDFDHQAPNTGGLSASSLSAPYGLVLDTAGDLYVADSGNNRVLEYNAPLSSGMAAHLVFGQGGSFTTGLENNGGVSANSLALPAGVALDSDGNLYIGDVSNNRVLEYDHPLTLGTTADRVIGQADFGGSDSNAGGVSATSLNAPYGIAVDGNGRLYVADFGNSRLLEFDRPLVSGVANRVFGQPDFQSNALNNGGLSAASLFGPSGAVIDGQGHLYVADTYNHRVLEYDIPLDRAAADRVFGQPGFSSNSANEGGLSADSLYQPAGVALDAHGNLFVADADNNRVMEYDRPLPLLKLFLPLARH
jgi:sugar lactone lactonase YvrE